MSDDKSTEIIDVRDKDDSAKVASRIAKCVAACEGIDDTILELLAKIDKSSGKTNLQKIVNRVDISGAYKALDPSLLEKVRNKSD